MLFDYLRDTVSTGVVFLAATLMECATDRNEKDVNLVSVKDVEVDR